MRKRSKIIMFKKKYNIKVKWKKKDNNQKIN